MFDTSYSNGAIVAYNVSKDYIPKTPDAFQAQAQQHGLPESLVPDYAGDRAMVGKAIQSQIGKARGEGWEVKQVSASAGKVVFAIARIDKDVERERIDYAHQTTLWWEKDWNGGASIEGGHEVAQAANTRYQELRGKVLASDWTAGIVKYLRETCDGLPIGTGGTYWVPPHAIARLGELRAFVKEIGLMLFVSAIEPGDVGSVREIAQAGLLAQIKELSAEVEAFDGSENVSVLQARLHRLGELRAKLLLLEDAVELSRDQIQGALRQVAHKVEDLLTVRVGTVIHKDGTRETVERPPVADQIARFRALAAQGDEALALALSEGKLSFDHVSWEVLQALGEGEGEAGEAPAPDLELAAAYMAEVPDLDPALALELATGTSDDDETF